MICRLHSQYRSFVLFACSFFFVGCLEDERKVDLEDVKRKLDGVVFDKESTSKFIDLAKAKLAELKIAERDFKKAGEINESISKGKSSNPHHFRLEFNCKDFELERSSDVEDNIKLVITTCPFINCLQLFINLLIDHPLFAICLSFCRRHVECLPADCQFCVTVLSISSHGFIFFC